MLQSRIQEFAILAFCRMGVSRRPRDIWRLSGEYEGPCYGLHNEYSDKCPYCSVASNGAVPRERLPQSACVRV